MELKIQTLVMPSESKHQQCRELFYRGDAGFYNQKEKQLVLGTGQKMDFATYLNGCSYRKWKKYTNIKSVKLYIEVQGKFTLIPVGYIKEAIEIQRKEYDYLNFDLKERQYITFDFPDDDSQILGFEIATDAQCILYGGYYTATCDKERTNNVELCIATTTCKKEKFIIKNVELLKKELLKSDEDIAKHLYIHVVDNGRTLSEKEIHGEQVYLHANNNTGGSGGFSRGMIEALNQTPKATNVLLMDDDVLILPESIRRTYNLLVLMKESYKEHFISGAMLYYEEPFRQHEDIGTVTKECHFLALKPKFDQRELVCNLDNEQEFIHQKNEYAGWWYCCIPTSKIEKFGLSLPIFIRCDDMEYSLRCKAKIITMNGICVWHMGFVTKYNAAFDKYQQCRNLLVDKASSDIMSNVDVWGFVFKSFRAEMLKFNYNSAELILRGVEDFLKGPDFFKVDRGEEIIRENVKLNDSLVPINDIEGVDLLDAFSCYSDEPRGFWEKWLFRITYNGQRMWPLKLCKKDYAYIAFDHTYQPGKIAMHRKLLAINPFVKTAIVREIDKKKYRDLIKRFKKAQRTYVKNKVELENLYKSERECLTSEKFWRNYLKINK